MARAWLDTCSYKHSMLIEGQGSSLLHLHATDHLYICLLSLPACAQPLQHLQDLELQYLKHDALHDGAEIYADACSSLALMDSTAAAAAVAKEVAEAGITIVSAPMVDQYTQVVIAFIRVAQLQSALQQTASSHFQSILDA